MTDIINLEFKVKTICFRDADSRYTICKCSILKYDNSELSETMTIKGYFPSLFKGDVFKGIGLKLESDSHGYYLELIDIPSVVIPENEEVLATFISNRVSRLSKKKALEIIKVFGCEIISMINKDYHFLTSIKGITEQKAEKMKEELTAHIYFEELSVLIKSLGLETKYALMIYSVYGSNSTHVLKQTPYILCFNLDIPFNVVDTVGMFYKYKQEDINRTSSAIFDLLKYNNRSNGHLYVLKEEILNNLNDYLNKNGGIKENSLPRKNIEEGIELLIEKEKIIIETNLNKEDCVYLYYNHLIEDKIAKNLVNIRQRQGKLKYDKKDLEKFIEDYEKRKYPLDPKQREGIYMALNNSFSILTGGPGTGKTDTLNIIIKCIKNISPSAEITLLAPTGRASKRMTELTHLSASTIHKQLKLSHFNSKSDIVELTSDFVIIDEGSMIDAYIFSKLISAISERTQVLFVGDVDQLPSVGAGLIFKDLIDSNIFSMVKLTTVFRQSKKSTIVKNSYKINNGLRTFDKEGIDISNKDTNNFKFWKESNVFNIKKKILQSIDRLVTHYSYELKDIQVLTGMRKGELGTYELNRIIQKEYNPPGLKAEYEISKLDVFREGDRVIQTENNYDLNTFNGEVGIIEKIYVVIERGVEAYKFIIAYPDKNVVYSESDISELELAYAMTIHKSQGSEFPAVIMPVHTIQACILYKQLVYTGVTRSKELFILIGEEEALNNAVTKTECVNRNSLLKEKLIQLKA